MPWRGSCSLARLSAMPIPSASCSGRLAGGNLTAAVSLLARERGDFRPRTQILLYPLVYNDHSETTLFDSVRDNGEDYILTRQAIVDYIELYLRTPADFHDSRFAPLIATSLADLPRTLVITAEYDPLRDEGEAFAARLDAEGNEVACFRMNDGVHGYFLYPSVLSLGARHLPPHRALPRWRPAPETR